VLLVKELICWFFGSCLTLFIYLFIYLNLNFLLKNYYMERITKRTWDSESFCTYVTEKYTEPEFDKIDEIEEQFITCCS
jgi:hypothetical protein